MEFEEDVYTVELERLGAKLYGEQWPTVRAHNVKRLKGEDDSPLGQQECNQLVAGLRRLDAIKRR